MFGTLAEHASIKVELRLSVEGPRPPSLFEALKLRSVADYQLGKGLGSALFPRGILVTASRRTGRIRHIYYRGALLATLRPSDGLLALTVDGARRLLGRPRVKRFTVTVSGEAAPFIMEGKSVFAKHVVWADERLKPMEEVILVDEKGGLLAVGKAVLSGVEMLCFKRGIAVKTRQGVRRRLGKGV